MYRALKLQMGNQLTLRGLASLPPVFFVAAMCFAFGGATAGDSESSLTGGVAPFKSISVKQRIVAAILTANGASNDCTSIRPFYWEIGSSNRRLAGRSVDAEGNPLSYKSNTRLNLGSASKWIYAAYVVQLRSGVLDDADIEALTLRSGYANMAECYPYQTVGACFQYGDNELLVPEAVGKFSYDGGHMQHHAVSLGLGPLDRTEFASEVRVHLGGGVPIGYSLAMPAGGANGSAAAVATFLRRLMNGQLLLGDMLGSYAVCTNPLTCPDEALQSPAPPDEEWHYSLGHWVEDDPIVGDGTFSSPGTLGFYSWISSDRDLYGLIARDSGPSSWTASVQCGRLIRAAWRSGQG